MSIKTSVSLLIVSALLVLPIGIARAGDIDVQTSNVRVTVGKNGGINIQSKSPGVIAIPHRQLSNPSLRRQHWPKLNRTSKYNTRSEATPSTDSEYRIQCGLLSIAARAFLLHRSLL